jgi:hypothetical protein
VCASHAAVVSCACITIGGCAHRLRPRGLDRPRGFRCPYPLLSARERAQPGPHPSSTGGYACVWRATAAGSARVPSGGARTGRAGAPIRSRARAAVSIPVGVCPRARAARAAPVKYRRVFVRVARDSGWLRTRYHRAARTSTRVRFGARPVSFGVWPRVSAARAALLAYDFGISEFRNFGISEFRNFGISEFRNFGISEFRNFGISEIRNFGISEFRNPGILRIWEF